MKIHLAWIRLTATAAVLAGVSAPPAAAQYAPYSSITQQPAAPVTSATPRVAAQPPYWQQAAQQSASPRYQTPTTAQYQQQQQAQYPQTSGAYVPTATAASVPSYRQSPAYAPSTAFTPAHAYTPTAAQVSPYPHVAYQPQPSESSAPAAEETMPAPVQEGTPMNGEQANGMNGQVQNGQAANGYPAGCNCANGNYPAGSSYTGDKACGDSYGIGEYFDDPDHDTQWFGGVYYLFMNRDNPDFRHFAAQFDTPAGGYPYYPTSSVTALSSPDVDHDFRSGVEIRFGSTLGGWHDDDCDEYGYGYGSSCNNCEPCTPPEYAWEVGYWILDDDENTTEVIDSIPTDTYRIYGMKNFAGLQYNGRPVNDYYDYQVPVTDPLLIGATDVRLLAQRIRSNFQAQNLELNFLHLPVCGGGCDCQGSGHCDECQTGDCEPSCGSPFSVTTLCGFRYVRIDDDFQYASMWAIDNAGTLTPPAYTPWDGANELYYDINVDNDLVGFQLGANMNYSVSCRCNLFWNSNFGLYNNHISSDQRVFGELGPATWVGSGEDATISSSKDDVAFVGEMLLGGSYDFSCHWRGVLAYRAVGLSGVALSVDQIPEDFSNEAEVALIDSDGSLIIHGVQIGAECRY